MCQRAKETIRPSGSGPRLQNSLKRASACCQDFLERGQVSSVFLVVKPSKIILLVQNTISQKEDVILLYTILGTIVSPNKILLKCFFTTPQAGVSDLEFRGLGFRGALAKRLKIALVRQAGSWTGSPNDTPIRKRQLRYQG